MWKRESKNKKKTKKFGDIDFGPIVESDWDISLMEMSMSEQVRMTELKEMLFLHTRDSCSRMLISNLNKVSSLCPVLTDQCFIATFMFVFLYLLV